MATEHKGGVVFDYWTTSPWHAQARNTTTATPATTQNHPSPLTQLHGYFDDTVLYDSDEYASSQDEDDQPNSANKPCTVTEGSP